jgi:hypothetical protein
MKSYNYSFRFEDLNENQILFIKNIFDDYSWGQGLSVIESKFSEDTNSLIIEFKSSKNAHPIDGFSYVGKKRTLLGKVFSNNLKTSDNIIESLLGKEQFLSNMYFQDIGIENRKCFFIDNRGIVYRMEISKYGDLHLMDGSND